MGCITLLDYAGAPVSKDALMEAAWPGLAVEERLKSCHRRAFAACLQTSVGVLELLVGFRPVDANDRRPDDAPGKDHPHGVIDPELAAALWAADVLVPALVAEHHPTSAVPTDAPALAPSWAGP